MQPTGDGRVEPPGGTAGRPSGLAVVYEALDHLVASYGLRDAALVVDVPGMGRQLLHAGRLPLHDDPHGWHEAAPGLYLDPPAGEPVRAEVMLAMAELGFRVDVPAAAAEAATW